MALLQSIVERFSPGFDRRCSPSCDSTAELGRFGERVAASVLKRRGYKILYRNWKLKQGEIDLICRDGQCLVFIEVKTRKDRVMGSPVEAVHQEKQKKIIRAASLYLQQLGNPQIHSRFDVVEVIASPGNKPECRVFTNAYSLAGFSAL